MAFADYYPRNQDRIGTLTLNRPEKLNALKSGADHRSLQTRSRRSKKIPRSRY